SEIDDMINERLNGSSSSSRSLFGKKDEEPASTDDFEFTEIDIVSVTEETLETILGTEIASNTSAPTAELNQEESAPGSRNIPRIQLASFAKYACVLFAIVVLGITFLFQLWHFPNRSLRDSVGIQTFLNTSLTPLVTTANSLGLSLSKPNNLQGITLISAQAEPHPNRPTTTLLRVSFVNKSSNVQQLPWLELSLTDAEGKVVARRALQPQDYIYNNVTDINIGAHELKKVTVELLSFPKRATGYELKMLQTPTS
ncbi:MAG: DUF3426 domain-containing protein, partial [Pseudomonadota bacterium]